MATVLNTANTQANISSNIYTNGNNLVTAAMVANVLQNISVSYINRITDYNLLGLKVFITTTQYQIGDCVVYSGQLYQCTTAHLGAWSVGDFALVGGGGGTVTTVSGVAANGFTWSIANASTTPAITLSLQNATTSQSGQLTNTDWNTFNNKQAALSGTGFVKSTAGVISYDTSTYLTTITGIGASGNLSGTYPSPSVIGALGVNYPALPTSGNYQLQAAISAGSVTAWSFVVPSNPMTTLGDIIYGGTVTSGVAAPTRLALGTQNYFLQAGATAPTYFNLFGTSNTFTASQNVTVNAGAPTYGMVVTNTTTSGSYTTNGAGIKFVNNTGIASINYAKTGGGAYTDGALNLISDLGMAFTANGLNGSNHNFDFAGTGNMTAVLTGSGSAPQSLFGLYNGNGGSTYCMMRFHTTSGGYIKSSVSNSSYLGITLGYNATDIFSTNTTGCGVFTQSPNSSLEVNGSFAASVVSKTANYTLTSSDYIVLFNGTSLTATLPAASGCTKRIYIIANRNATAVTISAFLNLANVSTTTIAGTTSIMVVSDGTNWQQIQ